MSKNNLISLPSFVKGRSIENSRSYMGNVMTFLVDSEQTDGAFSMAEYLSKPEFHGAPRFCLPSSATRGTSLIRSKRRTRFALARALRHLLMTILPGCIQP
jgi:hypothetical protein